MAPQGGKDDTRKPRRADSHETLVISISSDSTADSHFTSLKKKKIGAPQPRFDLNLLSEELQDHQAQSEVGDNNLNVPCFYPISHLTGAHYLMRNTTACGCLPLLRISTLEDTASSKRPNDKAVTSADGGHQRLDLDLNILPEMVPQFELPEVVPQSEVGDNTGFDPQCFLCPDSDLEAMHSGVATASGNRDQRPADSRYTSSSDSEDSDMASSDSSSDSDMASSDSSSGSGDSDLALSDSLSDAKTLTGPLQW